MKEPDVASEYRERDTRAAYAVLIELGQVLGIHRDSFVLVGGAVPLLVMKGYALVQRDKKKDAYDVYFSIRHYPGGPEVLAERCRALLSDKVAEVGYRNIQGKFANEEDFGPSTVKLFLADSQQLSGMTAEQVQRDAYRQVRAWLEALKL